jgi:hypothetical protein
MTDTFLEKSFFKILLKRFAFFIYLMASLFMALFSVLAVQHWTDTWSHISIFIACLLPPFLLILVKAQSGLKSFQISPEILFITIIIILGTLNIIFSYNRNMSINGMGLFLMSGVSSFISTRLFYEHLGKQRLLPGFFAAIFIFLCLFGFYELFNGGPINLLSGNPIPAGSLIILLSIGPMIKAQQSSGKLEFYLWLSSLFVGLTLVVFIGKKGPLIALLFMAIFLTVFFLKNISKKVALCIATFLSAGSIALIGRLNNFQKILEGKELVYSIYFRLENYFYGFHIFKKQPLMGTGFSSKLANYYQDYQQNFSDKIYLKDYIQFIEQINALENMALTMLVEMGGLMSLTYIIFVLFCILKFIQAISRIPQRRCEFGFIMAGLIGFFVHSMTYDSLRFPNLNWIFHSILGMMLGLANFYLKTIKSPDFFYKPEKTI